MKFSVIIPTFKRVQLLRAAVESVLSQTYDSYEIIIVNDNPDDREEISQLYVDNNKVNIINHLIPSGGNTARNTGISNSKGELIAFLDDDDIWLPEKLASHVIAHQEQPDIGLVFSDCLCFYDDPHIKDYIKSYQMPEDVVKDMSQAKFCPATSSTVTIKHECIKECGMFDDHLVSFQDWDYWFRIAHHFNLAHIPVVLVKFRQHLQERTSQNEDKRRKGLHQIYSKWKHKIDKTAFHRTFIKDLYYHNSFNALWAGKRVYAFKQSLFLLRVDIISVRSVKSFLSLSIRLIASIFRDGLIPKLLHTLSASFYYKLLYYSFIE